MREAQDVVSLETARQETTSSGAESDPRSARSGSFPTSPDSTIFPAHRSMDSELTARRRASAATWATVIWTPFQAGSLAMFPPVTRV
jgi:hypothetical protein